MKSADLNTRRIWASLFVILGTVTLLVVSAAGTASVTGCGSAGAVRELREELESEIELQEDQQIAMASSSRGPSALPQGERYRPPSLPPVIDHPSFIVIASPSLDRLPGHGDHAEPGQVTIDGQIVSRLTGLSVAGEQVIAVQVRMVAIQAPRETAPKAMRSMKMTVRGDSRPVEVQVQHDLTDAEGRYLFIFEEIQCGDEIWIASPSSNTVVLTLCDDVMPASPAAPEAPPPPAGTPESNPPSEPEPTLVPDPAPQPSPQSEPQPAPEPDVILAPDPAPQEAPSEPTMALEPTPEPVDEPVAEPVSETVAVFEPAPQVEPSSESFPEPITEPAQDEITVPAVDPQPEPNPDPVPVVSDTTVSDATVPDETVSDTAPVETVSDVTVPAETVQDEPQPDATIPDETVPSEVAPADPVADVQGVDTVATDIAVLEPADSVVMVVDLPTTDETASGSLGNDPAAVTVTVSSVDPPATVTPDVGNLVVTLDPHVIAAQSVDPAGDTSITSVIKTPTSAQTAGEIFLRISSSQDTACASYSTTGAKGSFIKFACQQTSNGTTAKGGTASGMTVSVSSVATTFRAGTVKGK